MLASHHSRPKPRHADHGVPKATWTTMAGVRVFHRPGLDHPLLGHIEPYTALVDRAGGPSLVITGGLETPVMVRKVVPTPRLRITDRHHVVAWVDLTDQTPDTSSHAAIVGHWAAAWGLVELEVAA